MKYIVPLKLGWDLRYTADFSTWNGPQLTLWETKGPFYREDARCKLHAAAHQFPWIIFQLVRWDTENNEWKIERVTA